LVTGPTMDKYIESFPDAPSEPDRLVIIMGVARALSYLHGNMVIHGDLKPGNIVIEEIWSVPKAKLLDFGLSRVLTKRARPMGGSLKWMAPELFEKVSGRFPRPSSSADVFSFGRVLHFVCTGLQPFVVDGVSFIRRRVWSKKLPEMSWPPGSVLAVTSQPLATECTNTKPSNRPDIHHAVGVLSNCPLWATATKLREDDNIKNASLPVPAVDMRTCQDGITSLRLQLTLSGIMWKPDADNQNVPTRQSGGTPAFPVKCQLQEKKEEESSDPTFVSMGSSTMLATPHKTQMLMLMSSVSRWHCVPVGGQPSCCSNHTGFAQARDICDKALADPCHPRPLPNMTLQCPQCKVLCDGSISSEFDGDDFCDVCGHIFSATALMGCRQHLREVSL